VNLSGARIEEKTGGVLVRGADVVCTGVSTDTRSLSTGDLFVPLVGEHFDGHDFLEKAVAAGARGCLAQPGYSADDRVGGEGLLVIVPDTLHALGEVARAYLEGTSARVVGITGSNGKTTTKEMTAAALSAYGQVHATHGNFNNLIGLPQTAFEVRPHHEFAVLEMGMNQTGEIARLTEIACPDVGLITSVAAAHLEGLGTVQGVARAKGELFAGLGPDAVAVINTRDKHIKRLAEGLSCKTLTVGTGPDVDISVEGLRRNGVAGFFASLVIGGETYDLRLRALGRHDVYNAALAIGVVVALGLDPRPGLDALFAYQGLSNRLSWKVTPTGVNVIDDTYNANPASMRAALQTLVEVAPPGRKIAVLGDMLEMGEGAAEFHEEIGMLAADLDVDILVAVGPNGPVMAAGYGDDALSANDASLVLDQVVGVARSGDWVLVKGSRGMRMERVVAALMGPDWEEAAAH
jgi:UDP-N-acetylmuramoyl-tripeptide--D-alanyl-D-alanine ligase